MLPGRATAGRPGCDRYAGNRPVTVRKGAGRRIPPMFARTESPEPADAADSLQAIAAAILAVAAIAGAVLFI